MQKQKHKPKNQQQKNNKKQHKKNQKQTKTKQKKTEKLVGAIQFLDLGTFVTAYKLGVSIKIFPDITVYMSTTANF